jgi:hypothetical protein
MSEEIAQAGADLAEMIRLHAQIAELKIKTENDIVVAVFYAYARVFRRTAPASWRQALAEIERAAAAGARIAEVATETQHAPAGNAGTVASQIAAALLQERLAAGHSIEIPSLGITIRPEQGREA